MAVIVPTTQIVFSSRVLRQLLRREQENVFISPVSLGLALGMAAAGARGETLRALEHTLGVETKLAANRAKRLFASFDTLPPGVQVELANSLWVRSGRRLSADYAGAVRESYRGAVQSLDFRSPQAVKIINDWVAHRTHDQLGGILDSISPDGVLLLVNAMFFHGRWLLPFDADQTIDNEFVTAATSPTKVRLMRRSSEFAYMEHGDLQAVQLDYRDHRFSLIVVLPRERLSIADFDQLAEPKCLELVLDSLSERRGFLGLPKVQIEYRADLVGELREMGIGPALGESADFSGLFEDRLPAWISEVVQKTRLAIDEEGTTAAASTEIELRALGIHMPPPDKPFEMIVDRPYLTMLVDHETDLLLFIGVIGDPSPFGPR